MFHTRSKQELLPEQPLHSDGRAVELTHQEAKLCQAEARGLVNVIREPPWCGHDNVSQAAVACHPERTSSLSVSLSLHKKSL